LLERFRSLPMAHSAVLTGRTIADLVRNVFVIVLMAGVRFLVGFSVQTNAAKFVAATCSSDCMSSVFATVGLLLANAESRRRPRFR
jgi:hypothetical protein